MQFSTTLCNNVANESTVEWLIINPYPANEFCSENIGFFYVSSIYSKTCLKRSLLKKTKKWFSRPIITLMQVKKIAECSKRAFCNSFNLY